MKDIHVNPKKKYKYIQAIKSFPIRNFVSLMKKAHIEAISIEHSNSKPF
jgi:hypothetical protein